MIVPFRRRRPKLDRMILELRAQQLEERMIASAYPSPVHEQAIRDTEALIEARKKVIRRAE
jgi:HEPN domain-containing protein